MEGAVYRKLEYMSTKLNTFFLIISSIIAYPSLTTTWLKIRPKQIHMGFRSLRAHIEDVILTDVNRPNIVNVLKTMHLQTIEKTVNSYRCNPVGRTPTANFELLRSFFLGSHEQY